MKTQLKILICIGFLSTQIFAQNFSDDLSVENSGDFPSKWDLLQGTAQIDIVGDRKAIKMGDAAVITPLIDSSDYLGEDFRISFDVFFDEVRKSRTYQRYEVRLWAGKSAGKADGLSFRPLRVYRHGMSLNIMDKRGTRDKEYKNYPSHLMSVPPIWKNIVIDYNKGVLKVFMDKEQILNIPHYGAINPSHFSVEAYSKDGSIELMKGINKVDITNHGFSGLIDPNVVIILNPEKDVIEEIIQLEKVEDTLKVKEKYKGQSYHLGKLEGGYMVKETKVKPLRNSTLTYHSNNKTIINLKNSKGDMVDIQNYEKKGKVVSNKNGHVVIRFVDE